MIWPDSLHCAKFDKGDQKITAKWGPASLLCIVLMDRGRGIGLQSYVTVNTQFMN